MATAAHPSMLGTHLADTFIGGAQDNTFVGFGDIDKLIFTPGSLADTFADFVAGMGGDVVELITFPLLRSVNDVLAFQLSLVPILSLISDRATN
jgi:hypothetical protein